MNLAEQLAALSADTYDSLACFLPEMILCVTIVLLLMCQFFSAKRCIHAVWISLAGTLVAFVVASFDWWYSGWFVPERIDQEIFTGMLIFDSFTLFFRLLLLGFLILFLIFTRLSEVPNRENAADLHCLMLGAVVGMCTMASANHLMMVFLAVELASIPSYALAGLQKDDRKASEAALKFAVYGAGAAGIMLYGITLLAGTLGTAHLPTAAERLAEMVQSPHFESRQTVLLLGGLMTLAGLGFKLTAFPFHFWCPDVFEGATAEIGAFLSIASKAAALALLVRLCLGFSGEALTETSARLALVPVQTAISTMLMLLAAITTTFGNFAAFGQTNIKRLLAYSTIAHAGYLMMPIAAAVALLGVEVGLAREALAAMNAYAIVYLFMNLVAFAIVAFLRNEIHSEEIASYAGLIQLVPGVAICMTFAMFSLVGLPPWAGFLAKVQIFAALARAEMWPLLTVGAINTVVSLFYYLRVVKVMAFESPPTNTLALRLSLLGSPRGLFLLVVTIPLVVLFFLWQPVMTLANFSVQQLFVHLP